MLKLIFRGLVSVLLELATLAVLVALVAIGLSAYLTARFVGVKPPFSKRTSATLSFANGLLATAIDMKRRASAAEDTDVTS
jgi:hypothetical protein